MNRLLGVGGVQWAYSCKPSVRLVRCEEGGADGQPPSGSLPSCGHPGHTLAALLSHLRIIKRQRLWAESMGRGPTAASGIQVSRPSALREPQRVVSQTYRGSGPSGSSGKSPHLLRLLFISESLQK